MNRPLATTVIIVAGGFATFGASHAQTPGATNAVAVGTAPGSAVAARRVTAVDMPTPDVTLRGPPGRDFVVVPVDPTAGTVSLRGPEGRVMDLPIADAEQLKLVAVGDQVQATYVEAAELRVTPTATAAAPPAPASVASPDMRPRSPWQFRANIYVWLPELGGKTSVPVAGTGGPSLDIDMGKIFPIKFAFMGNLDVSNGQWGAFTDIVYASFGDSLDNTRDFSIVNGSIPVSTTATLDAHLRGWVWTAAGTYRVVNQPTWTMDVLGGFRLLDIKQTVGWSFAGDIGSLPPSSRSGSRDIKLTNWDAIVGVKGRFAPLGDRAWFVPYYADIGTGDSDLTWQAAIGVGYEFGWGNVTAFYRYLDYRMKSGQLIDTVNLSGPMVGVGFHW